jgi:hypothetical protein
MAGMAYLMVHILAWLVIQPFAFGRFPTRPLPLRCTFGPNLSEPRPLRCLALQPFLFQSFPLRRLALLSFPFQPLLLLRPLFRTPWLGMALVAFTLVTPSIGNHCYGLSFDPRNFDQTEPHYYFRNANRGEYREAAGFRDQN